MNLGDIWGASDKPKTAKRKHPPTLVHELPYSWPENSDDFMVETYSFMDRLEHESSGRLDRASMRFCERYLELGDIEVAILGDYYNDTSLGQLCIDHPEVAEPAGKNAMRFNLIQKLNKWVGENHEMELRQMAEILHVSPPSVNWIKTMEVRYWTLEQAYSAHECMTAYERIRQPSL